MHIFNELSYIKNSSLALGFFDGIHLGHRVVLRNAVNIAKEVNKESCVITFSEHPSTVLSENKPQMLLTTDEKLQILNTLGVDNVFLLDFKKFSGINANKYIKDVLIEYFSPIAITTGFNHSFGYKKEGSSALLNELQAKYGYKYYEVPPFVVENEIVSCSTIRNKILMSDFYTANRLLGYQYFITGYVEKGDKIASRLGYPSANIEYPEEKIKIPNGVYFVTVEFDGATYNGVLNHGFAPTLDNNEKLKTEVHIVNFNQNIYGKKIKINFISKIRNQMKFENIEKLQAQIKRDIAFTDIYSRFIGGNTSFSCKKLFL